MLSLNKVVLGGNLTRDPEDHSTSGGLHICEFGLAVNRRFKDKDETLFVNITVFGKPAEACQKYLVKGSNVYVEGRLVFESWEDKQGAKRSSIKVVADAVQFVSRSESEGGNGGSSRRPNIPPDCAPPPAAERNTPAADDEELPPF